MAEQRHHERIVARHYVAHRRQLTVRCRRVVVCRRRCPLASVTIERQVPASPELLTKVRGQIKAERFATLVAEEEVPAAAAAAAVVVVVVVVVG